MLSRAIAVWFCCVSLAAWAAPPFGTDLSGHPVEQIAPAGSRAIVLFFAASDCPICNRYIPEMERLDREFAQDGVRFWWVYPNPEDTAGVVRSHDQQYDIHAETVLDTDQRLTRMARATTTPEVALFVPAGTGLREVYRGRIDDRYLSIGQERPRAMRHDLEEAIQAVLANRPVPGPGGPAVGCSIVPLHVP
ncbi:MAG TPA: redoxin domain-containing protein [Terracidiphilus sp.]|nr:redoxin domain-containing protein [Terracidiphilus sp.]